jgi:hypothetical protein
MEIRRSTLAVDVVAVVGKQNAARFLSVFSETDFYCPPADVIEIESTRPEQGHFNLIHHHSIYKADIYIATGSEFERWAFKNRQPLVAGKHRFGSLRRNTLSCTSSNFSAKAAAKNICATFAECSR